MLSYPVRNDAFSWINMNPQKATQGDLEPGNRFAAINIAETIKGHLSIKRDCVSFKNAMENLS